MTLKPEFHLTMHGESKDVVVDQLDAMLMRRIGETGSITDAAKFLGISYRNAWGRMGALEKHLGEKVVRTTVGGKEGGGAELTEAGKALLKEFRRVRKYLFNALDDTESWEHSGYRLSARNALKAKVTSIERGDVTSKITMRVTGPITITSIITTDAVDDLALKPDDEVQAIVKSTEVLIAKS